MTEISITGNQKTMSSREIAELTDKEHAHVMRDIRAMLAELGLVESGYIQNWIHPQNGQTYPEFHLPRDLTDCLLTGYSTVARMRVIKRWRELEAQAVTFDPSSLSRIDILKMAIDSEEGRLQAVAQVQQLETVVATQAPKVEALERIAASDGSLCLTDAAKSLQIQPRQFTQLLSEKGWIYRRPMGSGWLAYQDRIQQGLMEHKVTTGEKSNGTEWTATQPRITPKGLVKLAAAIGTGQRLAA